VKYFSAKNVKSCAVAQGEIKRSAFGEMKSTHRRSDFTRRQAYFTLRSNISPTRQGGFR